MMVLGKEKDMNRDVITFVVGAVLISITAIVCITYYSLKKDEAMKSNIESAIVKGIDPLAVRCAYESTGSTCIIYAASHGRDSQAKK